MGNPLTTGVTGLIAHRRMLDVVGNNLANVNSVGYKTQRALFSELFYETIRSASAGNGVFIGGINPSQVGSGVKISQIDRDFSQGSLELTGGEFDFALQGNGFFVVDSGDGTFFTRSGAFAVDANQNLVDPATGYGVQRHGTIGEASGFQEPGNNSIRIPFGVTIPGEATTRINVAGNLSAEGSAPAAAVLTSNSRFLSGGAAATSTTLLNNLDSNSAPYIAGDTITISGRDAGGTDVLTTFNVDGTTTLGDLVSAISGAYPDATATLDTNGNIVLSADNVGVTPLQITLTDGFSNTGGTSFDIHQLITTTVGAEGEEVNTAVEFVDSLGRPHTLRLIFERQVTNHTWAMRTEIDTGSGTIADPSLGEIRFNDDGSFQQASSTGSGTVAVSVQLNGISDPQTLVIDLGDPNSFQGLTQTLTQSAPLVESDGFVAGTLTSVAVSADGVVNGIASNGRIVQIAQLAIASFSNVKGLEAVGDSYYRPSANSGQAQSGAAQSGGRGRVSSGQLETSNVDIAFEFTRLITAQRGFSANARTITVSDEVLQELTNLIR